MPKHTTYQERFKQIDHWLPSIIESVKKDLKNDHLKNDWQFLKAHFPGKVWNKLTTEELTPVYRQTLSEGSEELGEFIATRWLLKNSEIFYFFEEQLRHISSDITAIEILDLPVAQRIKEESIKQFGAYRTYIFAVLNEVAFPKEIFDDLSKKAQTAEAEREQESSLHQKQASLENLQRSHAQEIARLTDKYEKKLLGLQKKYNQDVDSLKKQLANVHRKQGQLV